MGSIQLVVLAVFVVACNGLLFGHKNEKWDNLKVTWGLNPLSSTNFAAMPLTEQAAMAQGFTKISDCGDNPSLPGKRYVKDNDMALILIYDVQGQIAGIAGAVPTGLSNGYPSNFLKNHPFVMNNNHHHISAYFVNPSIVCGTGRSKAQATKEGLGTELYIQNGTDAVANSIKIPHVEKDVAATQWTRGKCFASMGVHYWFNIKKDMSCDFFYPVFLLYNGGVLDAFGWAFQTPLTSKRVEHPPKNVISAFMSPPPDCLYNAGTLSTLHIYMTSHPERDLC